MATKKEADKQAEEDLSSLSVEQMFQELQKLLAAMEDEKATLEESFACYEKGMKLVKLCNQKIDGVEKQVKMLSSDGSLEDFS